MNALDAHGAAPPPARPARARLDDTDTVARPSEKPAAAAACESFSKITLDWVSI